VNIAQEKIRTVTLFSNFLNHHQLPFCNEMCKLLGNGFHFVATEPIPQERLDMGYQDMSVLYPFSLNTYSSEEAYQRALQLGYESDVAIIGSAPISFVKKRLKENKLTFYYSERIFREGKQRAFYPRMIVKLLRNHHRFFNKELYMLCSSAYTASDFHFVRVYRNKTFKWGYFPEIKEQNIDKLFQKKRQNLVPKMVWVGRLLDLKHPDDALEVASGLKVEGIPFSLDIIGTGPLQSKLFNLIEAYGLSKEVRLLGSMSPDEVRKHMEEADIFLFTSDFREGWGAVLNEAMNSGCTVIASHAIGSVPFLLEHRKNGFIYRNGDVGHLFGFVHEALRDQDLRKCLGSRAYATVWETWNARVASQRLITLSEALIEGKSTVFTDGPCSRAESHSHRYEH